FLGKASLGLGKSLVWLGNAVGLHGLAQMGANLVQKAVDMAPRLTETLLGRQEAALRALLEKFRAGDLEEALRRALPLGSDSSRGSQAVYTGTQLPFQNLLYSLSKLLAGRGGSGPAWFTRGDIHAELMREYRRAADLAMARGDFRRAAYIYG